MRQILLFAALAASLALLSGCTLSKAKADTAEDMSDKAAYQKISAEEAYEMMASQEVVVVDILFSLITFILTYVALQGSNESSCSIIPSESDSCICLYS